MDFGADGTTADHAYWLSAIAVRSGTGDAALGTVDAVSGGFGQGDPPATPTARGGGTLDGGTFGSLAYTSQSRSWGAAPATAVTDSLTVKARNIGTVTVHPGRARLSCGASLRVDTDGPVRVVFAGCGRVESFSGAGVFTRSSGGCGRTSGFRRVRVRPSRGGARISFRPAVARRVRVDVLRHSRGRTALGSQVVVKFGRRARSFRWRGAGVPPGYYTVRLRARRPGGGLDVRRFVLERRASRFVRRAPFVKRVSCGVLSRFALGSPVFGGRTGRRLAGRYRLARRARVRVDLVRRGKVVRRLARSRSVRAGRTRTVRIRPRGLGRGAYRVRLTIRRTAASKPRRVVLTAHRL
jgi:hypothetical protein